MGLRPIPILAARYALGCTILCGKISQRPDRIELRLNLPWQVFTPGVTVAVYFLSRSARANIYGLSQVQNNFSRKGFEIFFGAAQH